MQYINKSKSVILNEEIYLAQNFMKTLQTIHMQMTDCKK